MRTTVLLLIFTLVLTGCAGMSKEECLVADWRTIGFEDGAAGRSATQIGQHRQACAKHGITPDKTAYDQGYREGILTYCSFARGRKAATGGYTRAQVCPSDSDYQIGYQEGLQTFCTYQSGYDYGLKGGSYRQTCPSGSQTRFLDGYGVGREVYDLQSELSGLEHRLDKVIADREHNEDHQDELKQQLVLDDELTAEDRAQILLDIDALREEDDKLEELEEALEVEIIEVRARLSDLGVAF